MPKAALAASAVLRLQVLLQICSWQIAQIKAKQSASSYGFSKCFGKAMQTDATVQYSPSWLRLDFSGHPCPEIAGYCTKH